MYVYHHKTKKNILALFTLSLFFVLTLFGTFYFYYNNQYVQLGPIPLQIFSKWIYIYSSGYISIFSLSLLILILCFLGIRLLIKRLFSQRPYLSIDSEGFIINDGALIKWSDVVEIKIIALKNHSFIGIVLRGSSNNISFIKRVNFSLFECHIFILNDLNVPQRDLYDLMRSYIQDN